MTTQASGPSIDGVLVQWGERLFYPASRIVRPAPPARLDTMTRRKAAVIRQRIYATVVRRAPQVMVKVTGGGRGMGAIAAHFRYISKSGRLGIEDDRGVVIDGKDAVPGLVEQWRYGGSLIPEVSHRREAFNIMLSMPHGTDAQFVLKAAREFAKTELSGHRYVMVLHQHQANPHVHLSVRAESMRGARLNPRKADLHRWRETFAEKLRGWGVQAEATRQATRGAVRNFDPIWRIKAGQEGRLREGSEPLKSGEPFQRNRNGALYAWASIAQALETSADAQDRALADSIRKFARESAYLRQVAQQQTAVKREAATVSRERDIARQPTQTVKSRPAPEPEIER
jgi:hypothetical protein